MQIGQTVTFSQGDTWNTVLTGKITRIWGKDMTLVTVKVPGKIAGTFRTYVRDAASVTAVQAIQPGDYVVFKPRGLEAPMKVTEVGDGWVELEQGISRFRMETTLVETV